MIDLRVPFQIRDLTSNPESQHLVEAATEAIAIALQEEFISTEDQSKLLVVFVSGDALDLNGRKGFGVYYARIWQIVLPISPDRPSFLTCDQEWQQLVEVSAAHEAIHFAQEMKGLLGVSPEQDEECDRYAEEYAYRHLVLTPPEPEPEPEPEPAVTYSYSFDGVTYQGELPSREQAAMEAEQASSKGELFWTARNATPPPIEGNFSIEEFLKGVDGEEDWGIELMAQEEINNDVRYLIGAWLDFHGLRPEYAVAEDVQQHVAGA